jgi:hexulose-6-phosphate isomerase
MQGRLVPPVEGRIQAFPWATWRDEFAIAERYNFHIMEWTLDQDRLHENPLLTSAGQAEVLELSRRHGVTIPSLTGDCFMQSPFWKTVGAERQALQQNFRTIADACAAVGISTIVVPLVDDGRLESATQEDAVVAFFESEGAALARRGVKVVFESDFAPSDLFRFIARLDSMSFGINYDIGNSAALGFDVTAEMAAYGHRILNVHVKDRTLHGATVPLGKGDADFDTVFSELARVGFRGHCILQTARAPDNDHAAPLCRYRDMTSDWLRRYPVGAHAA